MNRDPVPVIVAQHAEDAVVLRNTRSHLLRAPHVKLHQLLRLDERLAGHLDGLAVAREAGARVAAQALERAGSAEVFVVAVGSIEGRDPVGLERLFALAQEMPETRPGLFSAFGWVPAAKLKGVSQALLASSGVLQREVGLAACAMHGVDPQAALDAALADEHAVLRARALHVAACLGDSSRLPACVAALQDPEAGCATKAAHAAVLLGHRGQPLAALERLALAPGPGQWRALSLLLKVLDPAEARTVLTALARDATMARPLIRGIGMAGDAGFLPWLLRQMNDPALARIAGEAFSLITGLDLALLDLERDAPAGVAFGPNDDPDDDDTSMDEDAGLPWPDPDRLEAWLQREGQHLVSGVRWFMGAPVSPGHCLHVLRHGFQRQRSAAAVHLSLLAPGTPLFDTAAPAGRQQRRLAAMGG
ncbi:MAG: hypothetical protein DI563_13270 [Variovorax paradoxus]|uniref:TIGR02270 family protein n=1 Tax=Variovorax paradoxus TaxID=34073 RepID=A0A2W5QGZ1_VARPD|nr:MAG: hypothetical protein DI563_13270 [Variovorax paradoxus]